MRVPLQLLLVVVGPLLLIAAPIHALPPTTAEINPRTSQLTGSEAYDPFLQPQNDPVDQATGSLQSVTVNAAEYYTFSFAIDEPYSGPQHSAALDEANFEVEGSPDPDDLSTATPTWDMKADLTSGSDPQGNLKEWRPIRRPGDPSAYSAVPEPATALLLVSGLAGVLGARRLRRS